MLVGKDPANHSIGMLPNAHPRVTFAYVKQLWSAGAKNPAFEKLRVFVKALKHSDDMALLGRAYLKLGEWQLAMKEVLDDVRPFPSPRLRVFLFLPSLSFLLPFFFFFSFPFLSPRSLLNYLF